MRNTLSGHPARATLTESDHIYTRSRHFDESYILASNSISLLLARDGCKIFFGLVRPIHNKVTNSHVGREELHADALVSSHSVARYAYYYSTVVGSSY